MINWLINNPFIVALMVTLFMWTDWLLTLAQEKECKKHYYKHYQSYPINTIEGNPILQKDVMNVKVFNSKHFIVSIAVGIIVFLCLKYLPTESQELFIGVILGLFLLVNFQHLSNLIGYKVSRKGVYGKLYIHLRTGYLVQAGRYFSIMILLLVISIISNSLFIYGVTFAGLISAIRQFIWMKKIVPIGSEDKAPIETTENDKTNA
jgi:hypothetical protein